MRLPNARVNPRETPHRREHREEQVGIAQGARQGAQSKCRQGTHTVTAGEVRSRNASSSDGLRNEMSASSMPSLSSRRNTSPKVTMPSGGRHRHRPRLLIDQCAAIGTAPCEICQCGSRFRPNRSGRRGVT